jgi:hypothetical protein
MEDPPPAKSATVNQSIEIQIPKPNFEEIEEVPTGSVVSYIEALREQSGFSSGSQSELQRRKRDWKQKYHLKWILFGFVLTINIVWTFGVLWILWCSGSRRNGFHLDDGVLITLISTSIVNFVSLAAIVAKNLFPGDPK